MRALRLRIAARLRVLTGARYRFCTRRRWQSQKASRPGGFGGYTLNPKTKRYEYNYPPMTEAHAYSVTLQPPSAAAPPLSDGQKLNATAALGAIALLPGIQGVKSRGACPTDADVASLLVRHALGGCLTGTLRFPCGDGDDGASRVVDAWRLPARTHDEAQLRALLQAPSSAAIRFSEGRTRAEVTYASAGEAAQALKHINAAADREEDAAAAAQLPRAKLCAWTREPHAPRDGGWRAKLVLSAAASDGAAGSSSGDDAPRMARLHASTEGRVAALLWDAAHAHGIDEVDTSALVLVRAEERCEVAQPDWRAVRPRPPPPAAAGSLDLRFRPDISAARSHEALLGGPAPPPAPDARAMSAAATAAASSGAAVLVAHRRRMTTESRYEPYRDVLRAIVDVGRFTQSESKTASWVTMHAADETMPDGLGACLAVGRASGGRNSACIWGALHACGAVPGRVQATPPLAFATLRVTGARAATGELTIRADIGIAVAAAAELPRCRATEAAGDALALLLRHVAATRPLMAPPPASAPPPPPPAAAAGFCGVVGCAAHRASAGAALEAAAADCFSLERLYADSVNPAADTDASALPVPRGLTATLQPFQRSTLAWALQRETPPGRLQLHPLVRGVTLAGDAPLFWDDGRSLAAGGDDRRFGTEPPVGPPLDIRGGIIAEEMGMGKTLEVIALMLATKGTVPTVSTDKDGSYMLSEDDIGDAANAVAVALGQRRSGRRRGAAAAAAAVQHRITPSAATLVVVPRPLLMQWQAELERHVARGALRVHVFSKGDAATSATLAKADVVLTTFDALASQPEWADAGGRPPSALLCTHWLRVVVDEAHALRNVAGSAARFCGALLAERRWAISGTPIPAKLQDLYGLMCFLRVDPYCNTSAWTTGIVRAVEAQAEHGRDALTALLRRVCMRHTKAVVALPPRTLTNVSLALQPAEAAAYASLAARQRRPAFRAALDSRRNGVLASYVLALRLSASGLPHRYDDTPVEAAAEAARVAAMATGAASELADAIAATWRREAGCCASCGGATASPAAVPRCSHIMCGACADGLLEAAAANGQPSAPCPCCAAPFDEESLLQLPLASAAADDEDDDADAASGAKVAHLLAALAAMPPGARALVFSQFAPLLRRVAAALKGAKVRFVRFDGSLNAAKRDAALAEWRADSGVRALLLDTRLAACGLTLTEATRVFILDVPTSVGMLEQAAARAHRLGQTQPVTVQVLVAAGTIEARLALRHGRKLGGDGAGALRGADARALAQKHMEWLLTDAPLRDDSDSDDDAGAAAAAPGDVQVAADVLAAAQAAAKGKGPAPKPAVKLEHGAGVVSMLSDDEEDDGAAAAPVAKKARIKQTR